MKKAATKFIIPLLSIILLLGCLEEIGDLDKIEDYTWNPELALPISNSTFGLVDFLDDPDVEDFIEVDEDGLIVITYEDQFESQDAASYVEIPDETYNESISFDAPILIQLPIQFQVSTTETFDFTIDNPEGDELDSAILNSGVAAVY